MTGEERSPEADVASALLYQASEPLNIEKGSSMYSRDKVAKTLKSSASKMESTQNQSIYEPNKKSSLREQIDRKIKAKRGGNGSSAGAFGGRRRSNKLSILNGINVNQSMQALNVSSVM